MVAGKNRAIPERRALAKMRAGDVRQHVPVPGNPRAAPLSGRLLNPGVVKLTLERERGRNRKPVTRPTDGNAFTGGESRSASQRQFSSRGETFQQKLVDYWTATINACGGNSKALWSKLRLQHPTE